MMKLLYIFCLGVAGSYLSINFIGSVSFYAIVFSTIVIVLLNHYSVRLPNHVLFSGGVVFPPIIFISFGFEAVILLTILVALLSSLYKHSLKNQLKQLAFNSIAGLAFGFLYILLGGKIGYISLDDAIVFFVVKFFYLCIIGNFFSAFHTPHQTNKSVFHYFPIIKEAGFVFIFTSIFSYRLAVELIHSGMLSFVFVSAIFIFISILGYYLSFLYNQLRRSYLTSLESLTFLIESNGKMEKGHSRSVGRVARQIAGMLHLPKNEIDHIHMAALLHDIGKMELNKMKLYKNGAKTKKEIDITEEHVIYSEKFAREITRSEKVAKYVLYHHERWDGNGFPHRLKGEEIPLGARIIAAANEIDNLFQDPLIKDAPKEFIKMAYKQLDPSIVKLVIDFDMLSKLKKDLSVIESMDKQERKPDLKRFNQSLEDIRLLNNLTIEWIAHYDGELKDSNGFEITLPESEKVIRYAKASINKNKVIRDYIQNPDTEETYDLFCVPNESESILIFFNISDLLLYEQEQDKMIRFIYSDVIYAVTQGKLILTDEEEINSYLMTPILKQCPIRNSKDIPISRKIIEELAEELNIPNKMKFNLLLCTSEITTNVLKHATDGVMEVYLEENKLRILVRDNGEGIELSELPKSVLLTGYSSKASLGHGFSLVLKLVDTLLLCTGSSGTTIVLEQDLENVNSFTNNEKKKNEGEKYGAK